MIQKEASKGYWSSSLVIVFSVLTIWAIAGFGCSIFFRAWFDENFPHIGGAPFGFWMAQQGSIIIFVLLLFAYALCMNRLDKKHGYGEGK
jgi:putative solute:sodium symporter small subunit